MALSAARRSIIDAVNTQLACAGAEGCLIGFKLFGVEQCVQFSLFDHVFYLTVREAAHGKPDRYYLYSDTLQYAFNNRANNIEDLVVANVSQFVAKKIITPMHKHRHYIGPDRMPRMPVTVTFELLSSAEDDEVINVVCAVSGKVLYSRLRASAGAETSTVAGEADNKWIYYNGKARLLDHELYDCDIRVVLAYTDDTNDDTSEERDTKNNDAWDSEIEDEFYTDCKVCISYNKKFTKAVTIILDSLIIITGRPS